jgi:prolipoprotein diacylglyceryltransferase
MTFYRADFGYDYTKQHTARDYKPSFLESTFSSKTVRLHIYAMLILTGIVVALLQYQGFVDSYSKYVPLAYLIVFFSCSIYASIKEKHFELLHPYDVYFSKIRETDYK